jgi:hypothetical protein
MYAEKLKKYVSCLHVLLIDKLKFRAQIWDHAVLVGFVDGNLSCNGSKEFLAKFLLGAGSNKNELLLPTTPRINELEVAQSAIPFLTAYKLVSERPVLGIDSTGIVLHMQDTDGVKFAVKVVRPACAAHFLEEKEVYAKLAELEVRQVSKLVETHGTGHDISFLVVTPVGEVLPAERGMVESGVLALCGLHRNGFAHGDSRCVNFIKVDNKAFLIDFSHSRTLSTVTDLAQHARCDDIARFLASITKVAGCSNLNTHWTSFVSPSLATGIKDFVAQKDHCFTDVQKLVRLCHISETIN